MAGVLVVELLMLWLLQAALCKDDSISLPGGIEALNGSCVFITCSFIGNNPCCQNQIGVWISNDQWKGNEMFRNDTSYGIWKNISVTIGDVNKRNCSTQLDRVGPQQEGTYYFRTEGTYNYTFNKNGVSIKVTDKPLITPVVPVVEGTVTSLTCSAPSSCPSDPPVLTWSDKLNGDKTEESMGENGAKVTSVLRFTASHVHHNKTVTCTASSREQRWTNMATLNVTYSPKITKITGLPIQNIPEGGAVTLSCTSNANPPSSYTWYHERGSSVTQRASGQDLNITNVTLGDGGLYYCEAKNQHGGENSTAVTLNVQYPPRNTKVTGLLVQNISEGGAVTLNCTSNADPPSSYRWYHQRGSSVTQRASGQDLTVTNVTLGDGGLYYCEAKNKHGEENSTAVTIEVKSAPSSIAHLVSLGLGSALLLLLLLLLLVWCFNKKVKMNKRAKQEREAPDGSQQNSCTETDQRGAGRTEIEPASPEKHGVLYTSINFSKKKNKQKQESDDVYCNTSTNRSNNDVVYATVKR